MTHTISAVAALLLALSGCGSGDAAGGDDTAGGEHAEEHHDHGGGGHHDLGGGGHHQHGGGDEGHHEGHGAMHPAAHAFHEVLAPAWHAAPGGERVAASCEAAPQLVELAGPLGEAMADHVRGEDGTEEEASEQAAQITGATSTLAESCEGEPDGPTVERNIATVHDRFHVIMEALQGH